MVESALGVFGADRLLFGSDWPVAELGGGYAKVTAEIASLLDRLSRPERDAVPGGTAARFYGLGDAAGQAGR